MLAAVLLALASPASADEALNYAASRTTAQLGRIAIGARAESMAGAMVGLGDDPTGMHWNAATLAQVEDVAFSLSHQAWFAGIRQEAITFGKRTGRRAVVGLAAAYESYGTFAGRASEHGLASEISASDYYAHGAFALSFPGWAVGAGVKALRSSYESDIPVHLTAEAGFLGVWSATGLSFGASLTGIEAPLVAGAPVSAVIARVGAAYPFGRLPLMVTTQFDFAFDAAPAVAAGAEYTIAQRFSLRAGYRAYFGETRLSPLIGLAAGVGVRHGAFALDYGFRPWSVLGSAHRVTLRATL